jgi:hypothetical protein
MNKTGCISPGEESTLSGDAIAAGGGAPVGGLDRASRLRELPLVVPPLPWLATCAIDTRK